MRFPDRFRATSCGGTRPDDSRRTLAVWSKHRDNSVMSSGPESRPKMRLDPGNQRLPTRRSHMSRRSTPNERTASITDGTTNCRVRNASGMVTLLLVLIAATLLRRWTHRWGSTPDEHHRSLPGDDLVAAPAIVSTHAVTIEAPSEEIWRWLPGSRRIFGRDSGPEIGRAHV